MFVHAERFPTGSPLPQGRPTPAPFVLGRIAPYPPFRGGPAVGRITLDPASQTARYFGLDGEPLMTPEHGTSSGTNPPTGTTGQGDTQGGDAPDSDTGNDTDQ
ncbi:putative ATP-grasp-modified RiPP [Kitasatospora sp. NPDC090308]|uniref:putative ATP-grasp-modified RiPP n=1 Tax=Kitasatospora sp. NPDC090308 TaxID=3364082 RepID=UPI0038049F52